MDTGFDSPKEFTLGTTLTEQQELSAQLIARPLRNIIGEPAYAKLNYGYVEKKVENKKLARFFNPEAKGREYIQDGDTLIVKEDIYEAGDVGNVTKNRIYVVAVFERSNEPGRINPGRKITKIGPFPVEKIPYLQVKHLCLVKEGSDEAVDLAEPWLSRDADVSKKRRIGLLLYSKKLSTARKAEAIVTTNNILLTDTQDDTSWNMKGALGVENIPPVTRWIAHFLAAAKSTQKERDFTKLQYLPQIIADARQVKESLLHDLPHYITGRLNPITKFLVGKQIHSIKKPTPIDIEKIGVNELIRLERNSTASTFMLIKRLRNMGFDVFPGKTNHQIIQALENVLHTFTKRYSTPRGASYVFHSEPGLKQFLDDFIIEWGNKHPQEKWQDRDTQERLVNDLLEKYKAYSSVSAILRKTHLARARGMDPHLASLMASHEVAQIEPVSGTNTSYFQTSILRAVLTEIAIMEVKRDMGINTDMTAEFKITQETEAAIAAKLIDINRNLHLQLKGSADQITNLLNPQTRNLLENHFARLRAHS